MKRVLTITVCLLICINICVSAEDVRPVIDGIINWKKAGQENLLSDAFLENAGETAGDWFIIAMGRYGCEEDFDKYLAVIRQKVIERYEVKGKLHPTKATEWHRIGLAVLAAGGNPEKMGTEENPINLISDGTYNRGKTASLGRQGINGWIWGLIMLDSMRYPVPEGAYYSREDIITQIMCRQLSDGGFALTGENADTDITAMVLTALAPYYDSATEYTYKNAKTGESVTKTVRQVSDEALAVLSEIQTDDGDYCSWGTQNAESTAQVLVALCSLGIDPESDGRFIKNGNTLIDGIRKYRMPDGGFAHSYEKDNKNPEAEPGKSNSMASVQVMCGLTAYHRYVNNMRPLYDFRDEKNFAENKMTAEAEINSGEGNEYKEKEILPENEQKPEEKEKIFFTDEDIQMYNALPEEITTENYVTVTALLDKIKASEEFEGKTEILNNLETAMSKVAVINSEIDAINNEVREKLYPFDKITLKDRETVYDIVGRIEKLSDYDRAKILNAEDIRKALVQVNNLQRAAVITGILICLVPVMCIYVFLRIKKRRKQKLFDAMQAEVGGQAVLGRQVKVTTPWLTERHGYDPTYINLPCACDVYICFLENKKTQKTKIV